MDEIFGLIDYDNFYVSCERMFRPHLEGKPVIVVSNNDGNAILRDSPLLSRQNRPPILTIGTINSSRLTDHHMALLPQR